MEPWSLLNCIVDHPGQPLIRASKFVTKAEASKGHKLREILLWADIPSHEGARVFLLKVTYSIAAKELENCV